MTTVAANPTTTTTTSSSISQFNNITLGGTTGGGVRGLLKLTPTSIVWKSDPKSETVDTGNIVNVHWIRITQKVFQISLILKDSSVVKFDGFREQDYDTVFKFFNNIKLTIEQVELSTKGSNFGELSIGETMITFTNGSKLSFQIPSSDISQTTVNPNHRNELTLEFQRDDQTEKEDESLVEIRFFTPSRPSEELTETRPAKEKKKKPKAEGEDEDEAEDEDEMDEEEEEEEEEETERKLTIIETIQNSIRNKIDQSTNIGSSLVVLNNIRFVIPRGRMDIEWYPSFFKLHGKTHDYKIKYQQVSRLFQFQQADKLQFVISLEPPIRQGKTKYAHLVLSLEQPGEGSTDEQTIKLTLTDEIQAKYPTLQPTMSGPTNTLLSKLFKATTGKKLTDPGSFKGDTGYGFVKCSLKANEGTLFILERSFFFLPKPPTYVKFDEVSSVEFLRVSQRPNKSQHFDLNFTLKNSTVYSFTTIPRSEFENLSAFLKEKRLHIELPDFQTMPMMMDIEDEDDSDYVPSESDDDDDDDESEESSAEESKKKKQKKSSK